MLDHYLIVLLATGGEGERGEAGPWRRLQAGGREAGERSALRADRTHRRADCGVRAEIAAFVAGIAAGGRREAGAVYTANLIVSRDKVLLSDFLQIILSLSLLYETLSYPRPN